MFEFAMQLIYPAIAGACAMCAVALKQHFTNPVSPFGPTSAFDHEYVVKMALYGASFGFIGGAYTFGLGWVSVLIGGLTPIAMLFIVVPGQATAEFCGCAGLALVGIGRASRRLCGSSRTNARQTNGPESRAQ